MTNWAASRVLMCRAAEDRGMFKIEAISWRERGVVFNISRISRRIGEERAFPIFVIFSLWEGLLRWRRMFRSPMICMVRFSFPAMEAPFL